MSDLKPVKNGYHKGHETIKAFWKHKEYEYLQKPNRCHECNLNLDWTRKNLKFCSSSCAATFNNKNRIEKCPNKDKTKIGICNTGSSPVTSSTIWKVRIFPGQQQN